MDAEDLVPEALLQQMFPSAGKGGEKFMFATQGQKISRYNIAQDRIIMLSSTTVYLLTEREARRSMPISHLKYIIRSLKSGEVLLYFADDTDFRLIIPNADHRDEFFDTINMRFPALCPNVRLKLFGVPDASLKQYRAAKKGFGAAFMFENEPDPQYRMRDREVATEAEYAEEKTTPAPSDQSAANFDFTHRGSAVQPKAKKINAHMVQPAISQDEVDLGDDLITDEDMDFDNLDAHFSDLFEAEKAKDGGKRKRRLNQEEMQELR